MDEKYEIKADVLSADDIAGLVPPLKKHPKLVSGLMKFFDIDKVNKLHQDNGFKEGVEVPGGMLKDLDVTVKIENEQVLENLPEGAFITVSNHPFGAIEGIMLTWLVGRYRPNFKVMVNMILNKITGMRRYFIAVDALASDDPVRQAVSRKGIMECLRQLKEGEPLGFFPAGAVSKINKHLRLEDREWQPSVIRIIQKAKVPVIPIFFQGHNSTWFNILGMISWKIRTLRLPAEVFNKKHKTLVVTVGDPITPEEQAKHQDSIEEFGTWLKAQTYALRDN